MGAAGGVRKKLVRRRRGNTRIDGKRRLEIKTGSNHPKLGPPHPRPNPLVCACLKDWRIHKENVGFSLGNVPGKPTRRPNLANLGGWGVRV